MSQIVEYLPGKRVRAQVELEWQGTDYQGVAEGDFTETAEFVFAAKATCRALEAILASTNVQFRYLKCEPVGAVGIMLAVAAVSVESGDSHQYTVGVCPLKDEPGDSAVRAVLNATNRSMSVML